jgi:hypothetical protein
MAQAVPISLYVSLETVKVVQCKVKGRARAGQEGMGDVGRVGLPWCHGEIFYVYSIYSWYVHDVILWTSYVTSSCIT